VTRSGGQLIWRLPYGPWPLNEILPEANVILLRGTPAAGLTRVTGTIEIQSSAFPLKPPGQEVPATYRQGALYPLFFHP
jgi:hypothetical protein